MENHYRKPNIRWARPEERMPKTNDLRAKQGYKIFIANRGEVTFSIPEPWLVSIGDDSIRMNDKEPPDDDCVLQVSVHYLPPGIDWSGLTLRSLVESRSDDDSDERRTLARGKVIEVKRPDLVYAWFEQRILDVKENREALSRLCFARAKHIQPLITFDLWPEDAKRLDPVWNEVLRSLRVGNTVPATGKPIPPRTKGYLH